VPYASGASFLSCGDQAPQSLTKAYKAGTLGTLRISARALHCPRLELCGEHAFKLMFGYWEGSVFHRNLVEFNGYASVRHCCREIGLAEFRRFDNDWVSDHDFMNN
jgi:hypothetical protein